MKLKLLIVPAVATALTAQGPGGGFSFIRMHPVLSALDSDEDGTVSAKELKNAPKVLAKLDKDKDGQLTREELRPAFGGGRGPGGPRGEGGPGGEGRRGGPGGRDNGPGGPQGGGPDEMVKTIMAFDKNGDGKISKEELPERMQGMFDRADTDKDGFLSKDEITKLAAARAGNGPQGGPDGEREGRGPGGPGGRPDAVFAALDTNNDGVISADEIKASVVSLAKLDKNGDGKITEDEVRPQMPMGRGGPRGEGRPQER